ncbi:MAG: site-specific DNA-methyltransferase [Ignavibacteriaceae bacterium]|nr:site-specific DNA-methyltransferase [Ignavibacteriaceae bacterium]
MQGKIRAPLNRTIDISPKELLKYKKKLLYIDKPVDPGSITNKIINQDLFNVLEFLPKAFVDLLFIDPPYNLRKNFNSSSFKEMCNDEYEEYIDSWLSRLVPLLKPDASIYICGDWKSSLAIYNSARKYFIVRNRITWEREKGRGAKSNWKNCSEDIWFLSLKNEIKFNIEQVKIKRKVLAPYKDNVGNPKDWNELENGNFRTTYPSNIWTDITVPFWSMSENTDHPTQKPEKLLAKIILASSNKGDLVFDPFLGSGTTAVTAKKLGRNYLGIEIDSDYCCLAEKRLELSEENKTIQGYDGQVFWERNSLKNKK